MNRLCWRLVSLVSKGLEPAERDFVRGDLAECSQTGPQALRDVLGLVARRQAALWTGWRPWLAAIGIASGGAWFLSEIVSKQNAGIGVLLDTYLRYGIHYDTGVTAGQDIFSLVCSSLAILLWSWTCGYALGSLSGRTIWITAPLFYLVVLNAFWLRLVLSGAITLRNAKLPILLLFRIVPIDLQAFFFLFAAISGMRRGFRTRALGLRPTLLLAAATVILTVLLIWTGGWYEAARVRWSEGAWSPVPWTTRLLPFAIVSWPVAYLIATAATNRHLSSKENRT